MNKIITVIQLLNKIANGEEVPEKIKIRGNTLKWIEIDFGEEKGYKVIDKNSIFYWLQDIISLDSIEDLNDEVEILEDNTEEIEELDREVQVGYSDVELAHQIGLMKLKINELVRRINYIERKINDN